MVSVVLATKNEEANIGNHIECLKKQAYPADRIELIVVDLDSTDKTREIAKRFTDNVFNFPEIVNLKRVKNYRGAQVNFGVAKSRGEVLFLPDTDMTYEPQLIKEAVNLIFQRGFDALFVPEEIVGTGYFGKIRNFERSFYNQTCIDALRFVKRDLFEKIGGFDEKKIEFGPDDWDFTKRIKSTGAKITITKAKIFHNEKRVTLNKYFSKKAKYVAVFDSYINKWGIEDEDVRKQFGFWYRYFGVFLEAGKWKRFLSRPDLALGVYFLRFVVGLIFLSNLLRRGNKLARWKNFLLKLKTD